MDSATIAPQSCAPDSPHLEGRLNNEECSDPNKIGSLGILDGLETTNVDNGIEEGEKQEDEKGPEKSPVAGLPGYPGRITKPSSSSSSDTKDGDNPQ